MPPWNEILIALALLLGTFFTVVAGIGLIRLPDIFCRMHAAGKAGTLGVSLVIFAAALFFILRGDYSIAVRGSLAIFFQFLTTPAATHLLARASYIIDYPLTDRTAVDEAKAFLPSRPDETFGQE